MRRFKSFLTQISAAVHSTRTAYRIILLYAILALVVVIFTIGEGIPQMLETLQSVLVSLAAIAGVIVAAQGLDTWHKQIKGQADYDLAMRLGKDVIHLRDLLCSAGSLRFTDQRSQDNYCEVSLIPSWKNPTFIHDMDEAMGRIRRAQTEAEVLWGGEAHKVFTPLFQLYIELKNYIGYLNSKNSTTAATRFNDSIEEEYKDRRNPISKPDAQKENEFQREVKREAEEVRKFLRKYLEPSV